MEATRISTVAYLAPVAALLDGVLFLEEPLTALALAGLALILLGVAGVSGILRGRKALSARRPTQARLDNIGLGGIV